MKSVRLVLSGRVQGVGFRDWMVGEAEKGGVTGWVRNMGAAQVEAFVQGEAGAVEALIAACRNGPPYARVDDISAEMAEAAAMARFTRLGSV